MSFAGNNCFKFKCPSCGGTQVEKVETYKCQRVTNLELVMVRAGNSYELQEIGQGYSSMPTLLPGDGNEEYVCKHCRSVIGCEISEEESFSIPAGIYDPFKQRLDDEN